MSSTLAQLANIMFQCQRRTSVYVVEEHIDFSIATLEQTLKSCREGQFWGQVWAGEQLCHSCFCCNGT
eukprot:6145004-Amphidinium_carterae.1